MEDVFFYETLKRTVIAGTRPAVPPETTPPPEGYSQLMNDCWAQAASLRPRFVQIVSRLEDIHRRIPMPLYEE